MAKAPKTTSAVSAKPSTSRTGYKRKSNRRVDVLGDQLKSQARKALRRDDSGRSIAKAKAE